MTTVSFSSWNGKVVDARKGKPKPAPANVPTQLDGKQLKAVMGWDGFVVMDPKADIPSLTYHYLKAVRGLSCGECSVCSIGTERLLDIFRKLGDGRGEMDDLTEIEEIVRGVTATSKCNLGGSSLTPVLDAITAYRSDFVDLVKGNRKLAERDYAFKVTAPCMQACPAELDIPGYIELIRNARFGESADLIRERCALPGVIGRSCPAPCEEACIRRDTDQPLAIRLLKRAAADYESAGPIPAIAETKQEKVAIIGSGPAGLAAAYHLRLRGYPVTIFEASSRPGGMAALGIPDYRLPKDVLNREIERIKEMGVEIKLDSKIDRLDMKQLNAEGYKAFFLAVGAQQGAKIGCRGEDEGYDGYIDGVEFLRDFNLGSKVEPRNKVVIIGGGNVAIDCARTCVRLGFKRVEILYRRTRAEMPAHKEEIEAAEQEGVEITYLAAPVAILTKQGKVSGIECIRMKLGNPDESGRRRPVPIAGSEFTVKTDMVIPATGQKADLSFLMELDMTDWGTVKVDPVTYQTNITGVFAGGDCVTGPATLVEALDSGNQAARSIDCYLQGTEFERELRLKEVSVKDRREQIYVADREAKRPKFLEPKKRKQDFAEVECGLTPGEAMAEAGRCLRCYRILVWE